MTQTHDDAPLLTPFPRPNHLRRLRREREARRRRIGFTAAIAVGVLAVGSGTAAYAYQQHELKAAPGGELAFALPANDIDPDATLDEASTLLDRAEGKVDTSELKGYVTYLEDIEGVPAAVAGGIAAKADAAIDDLTVAVSDYEIEQERKAEEERQAKEAAAAAAALAAANTPEGAKALAADMALETYGWGSDQFGCLDLLWTKESGWNHQAQNPSSGAYGIPQSLPGSKMATFGDDWQTNAQTQIAWGLDYISQVYGTPCAAWGHSQAVDWY